LAYDIINFYLFLYGKKKNKKNQKKNKKISYRHIHNKQKFFKNSFLQNSTKKFVLIGVFFKNYLFLNSSILTHNIHSQRQRQRQQYLCVFNFS